MNAPDPSAGGAGSFISPQIVQLLQQLAAQGGQRSWGVGANPQVVNGAYQQLLGGFPAPGQQLNLSGTPHPALGPGQPGGGNNPGQRNSSFFWGGRSWGPQDGHAFVLHLLSQGANPAEWAAAHPQAAAILGLGGTPGRMGGV